MNDLARGSFAIIANILLRSLKNPMASWLQGPIVSTVQSSTFDSSMTCIFSLSFWLYPPIAPPICLASVIVASQMSVLPFDQGINVIPSALLPSPEFPTSTVCLLMQFTLCKYGVSICPNLIVSQLLSWKRYCRAMCRLTLTVMHVIWFQVQIRDWFSENVFIDFNEILQLCMNYQNSWNWFHENGSGKKLGRIHVELLLYFGSF